MKMSKICQARKVGYEIGQAKGEQYRRRLVAWFKRLFKRG
jgi:hypothetical protein